MDPMAPSKLVSPSGLSISELPRLMALPRPSEPAPAPLRSPPTTKPKATRAGRACQPCHSRKIRCDVVKTSPCSNCKVDKLECTEREGLRARRKTSEQKQPVKAPPNVSPSATATSPTTKSDYASPRTSRSYDGSTPEARSYPQSQAELLPDEVKHNTALPPFLHPIPRETSSVDVHYLETKGALHLPPQALQNGLLRAYVEYVHPYMPVTDLEPVLTIIQHRDGSKGQISLLLYQAIMLAASAFVDMKLLLEAGYPSRKAARKMFFERARLLHDFDYEHDRLTLVQSVLLLTYWHDSPDGQKDLWYWMGIAISAAHSIGLHRDPQTLDVRPATKKLRKRVWWSCFVRDRLIALGARKPSRISEDESDVPMLVESDFEIGVITQESTSVAKTSVMLQSTSLQRDVALMCIAKAQLCVHLGHALSSQYVAMNNGGGDRTSNPQGTRLLYPNETQDNRQDIAGIDADLQNWLQALPDVCQNRSIVAADAQPANVISTIHRSVLHMLYQTTVLALYRPQSLNVSHRKSLERKQFAPLQHDHDISWNKVHDAAVQISSVASELAEYGIDRLLPTTCVILILPAMIVQLLEMKDDMAEGREVAFRSYSKCMYVMENLRESFYGADFAITFLNLVAARAGIHFNGIWQPDGASSQGAARSDRSSSLPFQDSGPAFTPPLQRHAHEEPEESQQPINVDPHGNPSFREYVPGIDYMDLNAMEHHDGFGWNTGAASDLDMNQVSRFLNQMSPLLQRSNPTGGYGYDH